MEFQCENSYSFDDKNLIKSFRCEQQGNIGVWKPLEPPGWAGCLGILEILIIVYSSYIKLWKIYKQINMEEIHVV